MRCISGHSTLVLYAATTGTDKTTLSALLDSDSNRRDRFAALGYICGNRNSFDSAQGATLSPLNLTEAVAACRFPIRPPLGSSVHKGKKEGQRAGHPGGQPSCPGHRDLQQVASWLQVF
jgi:hypothetical protein